ncbi:MAG: DUF58 domain-containing protein [Armatimonadota bacterium]|nr:DUF58 domain-containing protein [Armatimonadota bacterium]MDR7550959.1 DUF58 domain-containing protein [Armatimonadota bacterium]
MPTAAFQDTPEQLLRRLQFTVVRHLDGFLFGDYRGIFYGPSLDLAEVREYQPGDEIRRIDWNVTARMNRLFVRQYLEERELTAWLLVDLSPSMAFGTRRRLKRELAIEFAGVASYIITRHGDKVGAIAFPGRGVPVVPPRTGRRHALRLVHTLQRLDGASAGRTDLAGTLESAVGLFKRRHLVFVISDFIAPAGWERPLRELGRRHDVVAVWVRDPAEEVLPDVGVVPVRDPETGEHCWIDTSDQRVRSAFAALVEARRVRVTDAFRRARVDHLDLSTAESMVNPLVRFVLRRRRRVWSSTGR